MKVTWVGLCAPDAWRVGFDILAAVELVQEVVCEVEVEVEVETGMVREVDKVECEVCGVVEVVE